MDHNVIMAEPYHAKKIYELLGSMLSKYEKEFGKIDKGKALKAMEKKRKNKEKKVEGETKTAPSYFG